MMGRIALFVDASINLALGVLLLLFNDTLASFLGVPSSDTRFYPNILGGVFIGITLALVFEGMRKKETGMVGLGLMGAVCINLCGGMVLAFWLAFGELHLPPRGLVLLWCLAGVLVIISSVELILDLMKKR